MTRKDGVDVRGDGSCVTTDALPLAQRPFSTHAGAETYRRRRWRLRGGQAFIAWREARIIRQAVARLLRDGALHAGSLSLDVPCGFGRLLEVLPDVGRRFGCDLSIAQTQLARTHAPTVVADVLGGLPFPDRRFDLVLCVRLFHHLLEEDEPAAVLDELARISRSHVLVSHYSDTPLWRWHRRLSSLVSRRHAIAIIDARELEREAARVGLSLVGEWAVLPLFHGHRFALFRLAADVSRSSAVDGDARSTRAVGDADREGPR